MSSEYWIWFNEIKGITLSKKKELLNIYKDPEAIYRLKWYDLPETLMSKQDFEKLESSKSLDQAKNTHDLNLRHKIQQLTIYDVPDEVKNQEWPFLVYYKGNLSWGKSVAIIGTRASTFHGYHHTKAVCDTYLSQKYTILAGLSDGIEAIALNHTINNRGRSLAFVPHGLDQCYPKHNWRLLERITENGGVVSPFPAGITARGFNFQMRNTLMAMWSNEIVIIEADRKSGALGIAEQGHKYKKKIYAVDGSARCTGNQLWINQKMAEPIHIKLDAHLEILLSHPIVVALKHQQHTFDELITLLRIDQSTLIQNLLELQENDIIQFMPNGQWRYCGW